MTEVVDYEFQYRGLNGIPKSIKVPMGAPGVADRLLEVGRSAALTGDRRGIISEREYFCFPGILDIAINHGQGLVDVTIARDYMTLAVAEVISNRDPSHTPLLQAIMVADSQLKQAYQNSLRVNVR